MSIILITNHDENIYNITKTHEESPKKPQPKFVGKFHEKTAPQQHPPSQRAQRSPTVRKEGHATMGLPEGEPPDPRNYLKKHTGRLSYPTKISKPVKEGRIRKKNSLPLKGETPVVKELSRKVENQQTEEQNKNFIKNNVNAVKRMKPKEPEHRVVIDRTGTTVYPEAQGLEPVYIKKPIFGRTPQYLVRFNKIKEKEYQMKKDLSGKQQPLCRYITRDEREQLLNGLKKNWEELQKQYQGLPILTDTMPKKMKKSKLESALKQLEKDIVLVERHPYIYVYNDADS